MANQKLHWSQESLRLFFFNFWTGMHVHKYTMYGQITLQVVSLVIRFSNRKMIVCTCLADCFNGEVHWNLLYNPSILTSFSAPLPPFASSPLLLSSSFLSPSLPVTHFNQDKMNNGLSTSLFWHKCVAESYKQEESSRYPLKKTKKQSFLHT